MTDFSTGCEVALAVTDVEALARVPVCVKTGVATDNTTGLSGYAYPRWASLLWLGGPFAWFLGTQFCRQRFRIELPVRAAHMRQFLSRRRISLAIFWTGVLSGAFEIAVKGTLWLSSLLLVSGSTAWVLNGWRNGVGVYWDARRQTLVLTRVHRDFAARYEHHCRHSRTMPL